MSEELPFFNSDLGSVDDPSSQDTPVETSGVSGSSSLAGSQHSIITPPVPKKATNVTQLVCPKCGKVYVRKFYFDKHMIAHDMAVADSPMPSVDQFQIVMEDLMLVVLKSMLREPELGLNAPMKREFLEDVIEYRMAHQSWLDFQTDISKPLLECLTKPSKLLPQNKYQEAQKKLNFYLGDKSNMCKLVKKLKEVTQDTSIWLPDDVARRIVFRLATLLLDQIQIFIAKEMQSKVSTAEEVPETVMSDEEKSEFLSVLGGLLRSFFRKGCERERKSKMFSSLCKCLKENFVCQSDGEMISSRQFMDKNLWSCVPDNENAPILIDKKAVQFFMFVEQLLKPKNEVFCSLDHVMSKLYTNFELLGLWHSLTSSYFGDENSVYVMKTMVSAFRELSVRLETERLNRRKKVKATVALRTSLKSNK